MSPIFSLRHSRC